MSRNFAKRFLTSKYAEANKERDLERGLETFTFRTHTYVFTPSAMGMKQAANMLRSNYSTFFPNFNQALGAIKDSTRSGARNVVIVKEDENIKTVNISTYGSSKYGKDDNALMKREFNMNTRQLPLQDLLGAAREGLDIGIEIADDIKKIKGNITVTLLLTLVIMWPSGQEGVKRKYGPIPYSGRARGIKKKLEELAIEFDAERRYGSGKVAFIGASVFTERGNIELPARRMYIDRRVLPDGEPVSQAPPRVRPEEPDDVDDGAMMIEYHKYMMGAGDYKIEEWASIIQEYPKDGDGCVTEFISSRFPEHRADFKRMENENKFISYYDFVTLVDKLEIPCILLTIDENEIFASKIYQYVVRGEYPVNEEKIWKRRSEDQEEVERVIDSTISGLVYDHHIYLLQGNGKKKSFHGAAEKKIVTREEINQILMHNLNKKRIPMSINMDPTKNNKDNLLPIQSMIVGGTSYVCNDRYAECWDTISKACKALMKKIQPNISAKTIAEKTMPARTVSMNNICDPIKKFMGYGKDESTKSFLPNKQNYKHSPILYQAELPKKVKDPSNLTLAEIYGEDIIGIDKNRAYGYYIADLPYLIAHDWRTMVVTKYDGGKMHKKKMYNIIPDLCSILLPEPGLYPGYHLIYALDKGLKFKIVDVLDTTTAYNYYSNIMPILASPEVMSVPDFKECYQVMIGKLERSITESINYSYKGVIQNDDSKLTNMHKVQLDNGMQILYETSNTFSHIRDEICISIQVKCRAYQAIYEKLVELDLPEEDIVQINTDSIIFHNRKNKKIKTGTGFEDWKFTEPHILSNACYGIVKRSCPSLRTIRNVNGGIRRLYNQYAGSGKTYKIINEILPELEALNKDIIILTPSHKTRSDLKSAIEQRVRDGKKYVKVETIQKYVNTKTLPSEGFVIIDEVGAIDAGAHDLLYYMNEKGYEFICLGDFNQMLPVNEIRPYNSPQYINYMFDEVITEFTNMRNDFTKEYYDSLITSTDKQYLINEIKKHNSDDPDIYLCYRHTIANSYNKKVLEKIGKDWFDVGTKIICINNKLEEEYNIWNSRILEIRIIDKEEGFVLLVDENEEEIIIPIEKLFPNNTRKQKKSNTLKKSGCFAQAYAINIHRAQGATYDKIHYAEEDFPHVDNRVAYVTISRMRNIKNN